MKRPTMLVLMKFPDILGRPQRYESCVLKTRTPARALKSYRLGLQAISKGHRFRVLIIDTNQFENELDSFTYPYIQRSGRQNSQTSHLIEETNTHGWPNMRHPKTGELLDNNKDLSAREKIVAQREALNFISTTKKQKKRSTINQK